MSMVFQVMYIYFFQINQPNKKTNKKNCDVLHLLAKHVLAFLNWFSFFFLSFFSKCLVTVSLATQQDHSIKNNTEQTNTILS